MSTFRSTEVALKTRCCGPEGCGVIIPGGRRCCAAQDCMAWDEFGEDEGRCSLGNLSRTDVWDTFWHDTDGLGRLLADIHERFFTLEKAIRQEPNDDC